MKLPAHFKRTKIVATYGPALGAPGLLRKLIGCGADVIRYNFSHGSAEDFSSLVTTVRGLETELGHPIGVLADLQGPKIRVGELVDHAPVELPNGGSLTLTTRPVAGTAELLPIPIEMDFSDFQPGMKILLDDGRIVLRVTSGGVDTLACRVEKGGLIREHKGVNFPGVATRLPALTEKDRRDAVAAAQAGADFLALSFVRRSSDMAELRRLFKGKGERPMLIAKIEKPQALENLAEICRVSDAIMVARGDLGVEVDIEKIGVLQKEIIRRCAQAHVPVITATQMLESMTVQPSPTRAEATDVTNAVLDGTDALMLSEETATGQYPVEAVRTMAAIAGESESYRQAECPTGRGELGRGGELAPLFSIVHAAVTAARDLGNCPILVHTLSGKTATLISRFRPASTVVAFTPQQRSWRQMSLLYGVYPVLVETYRDTDDLMTQAEGWALRHLPGGRDAHFVILSGRAYSVGATNVMKVVSPPVDEGDDNGEPAPLAMEE